jgi:hypothetical protein
MILDRFPRLLFLFYITSRSQKPEIFDCFIHDHIKRQAFLISSVRLLCFYFNGWMMSNKLHGCLICGLYMSVSYWKLRCSINYFRDNVKLISAILVWAKILNLVCDEPFDHFFVSYASTMFAREQVHLRSWEMQCLRFSGEPYTAKHHLLLAQAEPLAF